jgi:HSP20 family molecular chaperone IbpA
MTTAEEKKVAKRESCAAEQAQRVVRPAADLYETLEGYGVVLNVPGVAQNDVNVTVERGILSVQAPYEVNVPEGSRILHREFVGGSFQRSFRIPDDASSEAIQANLQNGQLTIVLPKKAETRPRRISLNAEGKGAV